MLKRTGVLLLIFIAFMMISCGKNDTESDSAQSAFSVDESDLKNAENIEGADHTAVTEEPVVSGEISTEESFTINYKMGEQIYEDLFLDSAYSVFENGMQNPFPDDELPTGTGIYFSFYAEWLDFWNAYPDTVNKDYEALYDEAYFEEHQLIWFYLEVRNNLCSVGVDEIYYDADSGSVMLNTFWREDSESGSIDMACTYVVANFIEIEGKYPLSADTDVEIYVREWQSY